MKLRLLIIAAALIAVGVAITKRDSGNDGTATPPGSTVVQPEPTEGAIRISMVFSPEKEALGLDLIAQFNREQHEANGKAIYVEPNKQSSGAAETAIVNGTLKPTIWSPAGSLWGRLLNYEVDQPYVPQQNDSIIRTPLVIAMWEPLARALGWPKKQLGFGEILDLAQSGTGWAKYGKPTYGAFKLGHTNPDFSTSGLEFVAAQYFYAASKVEGLTEADVKSKKVRQRVAAIEQSIVHYGDTTLFFADQMKAYGPTYASAVAMEEVTLLDFNKTRPRGMPKLVAIYPREGTFISDNPFIILDAPWVTDDQHAGAEVFHDWLLERVTAEVAAKYGFRSGKEGEAPLAPIVKANGVDPEQPTRILSLPEPRVLARIKSAWHADRKPANIMLVVDTSGSMQDASKMEEAKKGLQVFLKKLSPRDRVGLIYFADDINNGLPVETFKTSRRKLSTLVSELQPGGSTALYDAAGAAYDAIDALGDDSRINAVVLLSDGRDTASNRETAKTLARRFGQRSQGEGRQIRLFAIAYGADASLPVLEAIAKASGGQAYTSDPAKIDAVYVQISSFF